MEDVSDIYRYRYLPTCEVHSRFDAKPGRGSDEQPNKVRCAIYVHYNKHIFMIIIFLI